MQARTHHNRSGFTLLELLVVLSIGAALMVFGVPAFQTVVADQRSTATANEMIESMILARSEGSCGEDQEERGERGDRLHVG